MLIPSFVAVMFLDFANTNTANRGLGVSSLAWGTTVVALLV
jgi:hypothetical protein